jgi:hypothetical protein
VTGWRLELLDIELQERRLTLRERRAAMHRQNLLTAILLAVLIASTAAAIICTLHGDASHASYVAAAPGLASAFRLTYEVHAARGERRH